MYRGAVFNIPVLAWLPRDFPRVPPLMYVNPTESMFIKTGPHVDKLGRVYHPYLAQWARDSSDKCLVDVCRNFIQVFSAEPPLYKKPSGGAITTTATLSSSTVSSSNCNSGDGSISNTVSSSKTNYNYSYNNNSYSYYDNNCYSYNNNCYNCYNCYPPTSPKTTTTTTTVHFNPVPGRPPIPTLRPVSVAVPTAASSSTNLTAVTVRTEQQKKQPNTSLLDAAPGDESDNERRHLGYRLALVDRLEAAFNALSERTAAENNKLLDQNASLNSSALVIASEKRQLEETSRRLGENIRVLERKLEEAKEKQEELKSTLPHLRGERLEPEEVFSGLIPQTNGLFELVGEEAAIDDVIYYLGEALRQGKADGGLYVRMVRRLAQKQFMAKALIAK
ncbi:suppressor protein stp22 of temperature-sensitive alpha-factor receptor and arginine permease, partial [Spiromyces aspiralis]